MLYHLSTESMADNARSFVLPFALSAVCIFFLNKLTDFRKFYVSGVQCSSMCAFIFFGMNGLYGHGLIYMQTMGSICIL